MPLVASIAQPEYNQTISKLQRCKPLKFTIKPQFNLSKLLAMVKTHVYLLFIFMSRNWRALFFYFTIKHWFLIQNTINTSNR